MRIAIDISQIVHEGTGVATYVRKLVAAVLKLDTKNDYVLFGTSLRKRAVFEEFFLSLQKLNKNVRLVTFPIPPTLLEIMWNRLHIVPAEWLVGDIDIFWSSDWAQPPLQSAKGITTIHDLIALKFPEETDDRIVAAHTRRLKWVKKECQTILCDSKATMRDVEQLLNIPAKSLRVVYPGTI
ncbi:glycosyltransferase [Candidatus Gottesmanbacteria bacterium]|nr:glycosyltransferase [Candidatus Gottesmanbacteria bacterium]